MNEDLEQFIESARWFGGKGRDATVADVRRIGSLGSPERDGTPFWRVRTGGFADLGAARGFCEQVRARGFTCFVVSGS